MTAHDSAGRSKGSVRRFAAASVVVSPLLFSGCGDRIVEPVRRATPEQPSRAALLRAVSERLGLPTSTVWDADTILVNLPD